MADNFNNGDEAGDEHSPFDDDEPIGYKNPPRKHQFKVGNQAAKNRRQNPVKTLRKAVIDVLGERVTVTIKGKRKRTTNAEALARFLVANGSKSVADAIRVLNFGMQAEPPEPPPVHDHPGIEISFVHRDWSDDPLPGSEAWNRKQKKQKPDEDDS